jgi:lipoprotein-anchoring transpeptidase ErfK/SrfK
MVRFAWGRTLAIGFHSIPEYADGTQMHSVEDLGTYQSAGCVRQEVSKAEALFNWAEIGTPVHVTA